MQEAQDLISEIREVMNIQADREAGRVILASRKEWLLEAISQYIEPAKPKAQESER